jgi:leucyl/phenylalanyl-tRNA--protein transferase
MFSRVADASKTALVALARMLRTWNFVLIDCQVPSEHLTSLGAENIPRAQFLCALAEGLGRAGRPGRWSGEFSTPELLENMPLP